MQIYCCECQTEVAARLTDGQEIYPHRPDLYEIPFWICDVCRNYVGCHHKTRDRTRPLGVLPNAALRDARKHLHQMVDPLWQSGAMARHAVYAELSTVLGRPFHSAELRTLEEARTVYRRARDLRRTLGPPLSARFRTPP